MNSIWIPYVHLGCRPWKCQAKVSGRTGEIPTKATPSDAASSTLENKDRKAAKILTMISYDIIFYYIMINMLYIYIILYCIHIMLYPYYVLCPHPFLSIFHLSKERFRFHTSAGPAGHARRSIAASTGLEPRQITLKSSFSKDFQCFSMIFTILLIFCKNFLPFKALLKPF